MPEVISQPGGAGTDRTPAGPTQSVDRSKPNFEPSEDEKTVVGQWLKRVDRAESLQSTKTWRENLDKMRRYERGEQTVDEQKSRTNMIYATLAAQMPKLYARNPTIEVSPTDAVPEAELGKVKKFAETANKVIRKMLVEEGKLKKRAKANIRSTSVTSYGALKVNYQKEYRGDPIAVRRIEDTQDNLARIEGLIQQLNKTDDPSELAKKRDELKANLTALASGNEVRIYKGFVIDRMKSEDFLLLDDNVDEFDEYVEARALGHRIWMTAGTARTLFQCEPHGATRYGQPRLDDKSKIDDTPPDDQFICVIEIWDKENGVVRTTAKGMNRWLRLPYAPPDAPQRWYPFYLLGFNLTEGSWRPLSDVEMLTKLQDEYDRTRQNFADVREKITPVLIFRKSGELTEEDVKHLTDRKNKDTIGIEGNPSVPLEQDIKWFEGAKIDVAAYDVSMIRNDMDVVSGTSDAGRANLIEPKTATEAEIMNEAMQSRMGERRDTHEDLLSEMGEASLEVALRDLTKAEVQEIAGTDAEWPDTPQGAEDIFRMVIVKVRAGSSGKPNQAREREQWGQLMPVIEKTMQSVAELRMQGNFDMAEAVLELLRETLRRYDENLDLDAIIPPIEKDEQGRPIAQQQAAMELVKTKEQLGATQQELAQCQQDLQKAQAGEQAKIAEANNKATLAEQEAKRKAAEEAAAAERDHATQLADAERANALKIAQENRAAEEARIEDERAKRELDAKVALEKHLALIKAAADLMSKQYAVDTQAETARITAATDAKDEALEGERKAAAEADSSQRLEKIINGLGQTMATLSKAIEQMSKDSAERTSLVKSYIAEGSSQ